MSIKIGEKNQHVLVCRMGHISKEANGYVWNDSMRCSKLIRPEGSDKHTWAPCKKKVIMMKTEFARALYRRGWNAQGHWLIQRAIRSLTIFCARYSGT